MRDCRTEPVLASFLPEHARDAHGNLADQNRRVGPQRGVQTMGATTIRAAAAGSPTPTALLDQHACSACHGVDSKLVGPSFNDISKKYATHDDAVGYLVRKIRAGGSGVWGAVPMPPQPIAEADARTIATWIADTSKR
jgi:cytochrome c551/c552